MHVITSRTPTPSSSPHHSPSYSPSHHQLRTHPSPLEQAHPVPIPPPHPTELHHANALRYKHLYGFTGSPSSRTERTRQEADSVRQDASETTDGSEASYVDFLVENPVASRSFASTTTTTTTTNPSSLAADNVHIVSSEASAPSFRSSSTSPTSSTTGAAVFSLSGVTVGNDTKRDEMRSVIPDPLFIKDIAADVEPETPSEGIYTPRQDRDFTYSRTSPSSSNTGYISHSNTVESSPRIRRTTPRPTSSTHTTSAADADPDEFRCATCYHAGLCAELVMKDPSFVCGDTMTSAAVASARGKRTGGSDSRHQRGERPVSMGAEKTPWTGQRIERVVAPSARKHAGKEKSPGLRVLQGGMDYVTYDDDGDGDRNDLGAQGGREGTADMEDLGRAIEGTTLATSPSRPILVPNPSSTTTPSRRSHSTQRHLWNDIRIDYPASSAASTSSISNSHAWPSSNRQTPAAGTSSGTDESAVAPSLARSSSSKGRVEMSHPMPGQPPLEPNCVTLEAALQTPRSRSKSQQKTHAVNSLWALHDATGADVLLGGQSVSSSQEQYDLDDTLYGVDVVERGRRRLR